MRRRRHGSASSWRKPDRRWSASRSTRPRRRGAVPEIKQRMLDAGCTAPLIGDFHYNGHLLLTRFPGRGAGARQVPDQSRQRRHGQAARRTVRDDLPGRGRARQAGAHRRQRRLAQPGARHGEDAGEHRPRARPYVRGDHQRVHGALGAAVDRAGARVGPARRTRSSSRARSRGRGISSRSTATWRAGRTSRCISG